MLREKGVAFEEIDLGRGLSEVELDRLIGERDYRQFLNPKNDLFRERKMKEKPPSRAEALRLMSAHPNLIRRPIVISGGEIVLGFDAEKLEKIR